MSNGMMIHEHGVGKDVERKWWSWYLPAGLKEDHWEK